MNIHTCTGTDKFGFGFGGTGKKSHNKQFDSYGEVSEQQKKPISIKLSALVLKIKVLFVLNRSSLCTTPSDVTSTWTAASCPSPKMVFVSYFPAFKHNYDTKMFFPSQNVMFDSISVTKIKNLI